MKTPILTPEAAQLADTVAEVVGRWQRPAAGNTIAFDEQFRRHWAVADDLGWTAILDDVDCSGFDTLADSAELVDAAGAVTYALGKAGVAFPVRQTLIARALSTEQIQLGNIAVAPASYGIWAPISTVIVDAHGRAQRQVVESAVDWDIAARPRRRGAGCVEKHGAGPIDVLARYLLVQEIAGAACGAIELAQAYVSTRLQFGRPLLTLPAVAQELGRLSIAQRQLTEASVELARRMRTAVPARILFAATAARELAVDVASTVATQTHQLHGALGVTAEAALRHRTVLLWADRDEGLLTRDWGVDSLPSTEDALWSVSRPDPDAAIA